ncbi:MAG: AGE family epimerase/isomerase [Bacteroidota bacterium]
MVNSRLRRLKVEMEEELASILDWWQDNTMDRANGGFYGRIDGANTIVEEAEKGVILNTRILWAFSAAANTTKSEKYGQIADRAYDYLCEYFLDKKNGGLYWMLDFKGKPVDLKKQIYAQAFGIYGFTEYYQLRKNSQSLKLAVELYHLIDRFSLDPIYGGYFEAFTENWKRMEDVRLSEKDENEVKTMNTHLHILEAYTNLCRVNPTDTIKASLKNLILCFIDKFIDLKSNHLHLFFDERWVSKSEAVSYGHDIESSWLLLEATEVLGDKTLIKKAKAIAIRMAHVTIEQGMDSNGGLHYEKEYYFLDREKHWWVQAEAVIGFFNAYQISGYEKYLKAAMDCWNFIKTHIRDTNSGEWFWSVSQSGVANKKNDKAGPWKAPYHNGRMCLELIQRLSAFKM